MIKKENLKQVLLALDFIKKAHKEEYVKEWISFDCCITVDFKNEKITYPEDKGMIIHRKTTCNFSEPENFVVLECITSLLDKGYKPELLSSKNLCLEDMMIPVDSVISR